MRKLHNRKNFLRSMGAMHKVGSIKANSNQEVWANSPKGNKNKNLPEPRKLRPFILTCDKRIKDLEVFVESYKKIKDSMLEPILIIDDRNEKTRVRYHELLLELNPYATISQPRYCKDDIENLQYFMIKDFPKWALLYSDSDIVFIEDDSIFSSKFPYAVKKASQYLQKEVEFITFYAENNGYTRKKKLPSYHFMTPFNGNEYYGNVCVLFSNRVLKSLNRDWKKIQAKYKMPFDLKWGRYMESKGYKLYETREHYVDHSFGHSAIDGKQKEEHSAKFKK